MLRNKAMFERIIDGRVCQCVFDHDLPSTIGKEFANQFIAFILQIEEMAAKAAEEQKIKENQSTEEPKAE